MHFSLLGVIKLSIVYRGQAPGATKIQYMFTPTEDESGKNENPEEPIVRYYSSMN